MWILRVPVLWVIDHWLRFEAWRRTRLDIHERHQRQLDDLRDRLTRENDALRDTLRWRDEQIKTMAADLKSQQSLIEAHMAIHERRAADAQSNPQFRE